MFSNVSKRYLAGRNAVVGHIRTVFMVAMIGQASICSASTEAGTEAKPGGAVLAFVEDSLDIGTLHVSEAALIREEIAFVNRGDQPLILSQVRACCGTRITDWPRNPILPGETGHIEVQFRLAPRAHAVRRSVTVTSNASEPSLVHRIVGQVVMEEPVAEVASLGPKLVFTRDLLDLGVVAREHADALNARICFENQGDQPLILTRVQGTGGSEIKTWPSDPILPGESAAIELRVVPEEEARVFSRNVFILSNDKTRRHTYRVVGQWAVP